MTALLPCAYPGACQADTTCHSPPRFHVRLDGARHAPRLPIRRRKEACASHLGGIVHEMVASAQEEDLTEGNLTVLITDPSPTGYLPGQQPSHSCTPARGLVFGVIPLGPETSTR
jgi:hypothetical protein